jgi:uroporphyrinogen decarboxylase
MARRADGCRTENTSLAKRTMSLPLTSTERIARILKHQSVDRVGLFEVFWRETAKKWADEGLYREPAEVSDHFGLDLRRSNGEITPPYATLLNMAGSIDVNEVVEETETTKLVRDGNGALLRWRKDQSGAAEHVDFLVKKQADWEEHIRPGLADKSLYERRIDFKLYREGRAKCGRFFTCGVVGAFDQMSPVCGHENLLVGMAMEPEWVRAMVDLYVTATLEMLEILFAREGLPDGMWVWDDLGFKRRPFMSPAMYKELIFPGHKRLFDFAHAHALPVILHADGLVEPLVPGLIEAGLDCLQPIEVKAGMDLVKMKSKFGERLAFIGGMDARELISNDLGRVRRELEAKLPAAMAGSGYILQVDHSVPSQVNYETYRYFVEKGVEMGTY